MDARLQAVIEHEAVCSICQAAKKRVNDFCETGKLLFYEYAETAKPVRAEEVSLTNEQYARLVDETRRAQKGSESN